MDPDRCSNCGSPMKRKFIEGRTRTDEPRYRRRESRDTLRAKRRAARHTLKDEKIAFSFTSDYRFIRSSVKFEIAGTLGFLSIMMLAALLDSYHGVMDTYEMNFSTLLYFLSTVFTFSALMFETYIYGFRPRKLTYLGTNMRMMILTPRGRRIESIWYGNVVSLVIVNSVSDGVCLLLPYPFEVERSSFPEAKRFGVYIRKFRKTIGIGIGEGVWKRVVSYVDRSRAQEVIDAVNSNSAVPVKVLELSLENISH